MKDDTRKKLSALILEELGDKIKSSENLGRKLEPFTDLPVEKVADAIIKQFEYLLSSDLRDLIIHLIEQEVAAEESVGAQPAVETKPVSPGREAVAVNPDVQRQEIKTPEETNEVNAAESIMERYAIKEHFPSESMDIDLKPSDWFYLYGFCYAPDSTGKGIPTKKLSLKGIDGANNIFLLDYGDIRFYMNKLDMNDYAPDRSGKPALTQPKTVQLKYEHEKILNTLRSEVVLVPLPFWTLMQNRENIIAGIEDKYVDLLRSLIDVHDAVDWDVEVYAYDQHLVGLPVIAETAKDRVPARESRHQVSKGKDIKLMERLLFKEKSLAQEIHSQLLLHAAKSRIDFMIRLDNAFMDDWKSILSARYNVGKDRRKNFYRTIRSIQEEYEEYRLMLRVTSPSVRVVFGSK